MDMDLACMTAHGFNSITPGIPSGRAWKTGGKLQIDFTRDNLLMARAKAAGMIGPVPLFGQSIQGGGGGTTYSHLHLEAKFGYKIIDPAYLDDLTALTKLILENAKANDWLPIYMYPSTEVSNDDRLGPKFNKKLIDAIRKAGDVKCISSVNKPRDKASRFDLDAIMYNAGAGVDARAIADVHAAKCDLWFQNIGGTRFNEGLYMHRTGAVGRRQWVMNCYLGDPYSDLQYGSYVQKFYANNSCYLFPSKSGTLGSVGLSRMREGVDDYRYFQTLKNLIARAAKNPKAAGVAAKARKAVDAMIASAPVELQLTPRLIRPDGFIENKSFNDQKVLDDYRARAAGLIIELKNALSNWQWRGPDRDGKYPDTGLLRKWPDGGPKLLWTAGGCGKGYATAAVAGKTIFTAGDSDGRTFILAFDLQGGPLWKSPNGVRAAEGSAWVGTRYDGARATPVVDGGLVYHLSASGRLAAYDARTGAEAWAVSLPDTFDAKPPQWGYSEHVVVDGANVICYPGGKTGYMVALDKKTGRTVWANIDVGDPPGNASATIVGAAGRRQVVTMTMVSVIGVDAETGRLLWRHERDNKRRINCATPLAVDGGVYVTSGYKFGSEWLRLTRADGKVSVSRAWGNRRADDLHSGPILHDGHIYGIGYGTRRWFCLDARTGKLTCRDATIKRGSLAMAEGMLYCLDTGGSVWLIQPSPEAFTPVSRFQLPETAPGFAFAHPAIAGRRLYLRHADRLYAYDIAAKR